MECIGEIYAEYSNTLGRTWLKVVRGRRDFHAKKRKKKERATFSNFNQFKLTPFSREIPLCNPRLGLSLRPCRGEPCNRSIHFRFHPVNRGKKWDLNRKTDSETFQVHVVHGSKSGTRPIVSDLRE